MGRQIQIVSTPADNVMLLRELSDRTHLRVFHEQAKTRDDLWVANPDDLLSGHGQILLWPEAFPWVPEYAVNRLGRSCVCNAHVAPVLELSPTHESDRRHGRLYWGRFFAAPNGLGYDDVTFSKWVDSVWRYVRKISSRSTPHPAYVLPDAAARYGLQGWR